MLSAHEWYCRFHNMMNWVYSYDKADDGPECEIITRILVSHYYVLNGPVPLGSKHLTER
jgi:hypothetical protein